MLADNPAASTLAVHAGASHRPRRRHHRGRPATRGGQRGRRRPRRARRAGDRAPSRSCPSSTWVSQRGLDCRGASSRLTVPTPWCGPRSSSAPTSESRAHWTFLAFMTMATLLAAIAIVTDSVILVIGAMVLGPEFVAIAALGVGLVRRRWHLLGRHCGTLARRVRRARSSSSRCSPCWRAPLDLVQTASCSPSNRPGTSFIYTANWWSFAVAVIAGAAGVLALTSSRSEQPRRGLHLRDDDPRIGQHRRWRWSSAMWPRSGAAH